MQSNPPKSKQSKTVQPIKIINNQVINKDSPLLSPEWQQQQKSSKRSLSNSPASPTNNQGKKSKFFSSPNRFSVLSENEPVTIDNDDINQNEHDHAVSQTNKKDQPPPIYVKEIINFSNLRNAIADLIGQDSFTCKSTTTHLKIQPDTSENYRKLIHFLKDENAEYHTFQSQSDKSIRVVIKNIHHSTEPAEIASALEEIGFTVRQVTNIKHQKTKISLPLFFVDLAPEIISKEIFNISSLLNTKIKVEEPHKRREIPQCQNCQTYGHTRSYCSYSPRCVKCGGTHTTSNCTKSPDLPAKCALCNGEHPASYKGCIIYKELQQRRRQPYNSRNHQQQQLQPTNHQMQPINQLTSHPSTQIPKTRNHSYAEAVTTNTGNAPPPNLPETQHTSSIDNNVLTKFLEDFKCIINPLISLLTTVMTNLLNVKHNI